MELTLADLIAARDYCYRESMNNYNKADGSKANEYFLTLSREWEVRAGKLESIIEKRIKVITDNH